MASRNRPAQPELVQPVMLEGVRLMFRNLAGKAGQFNPEGRRNFCVALPDDVANDMIQKGWTGVRWLQPREDGDTAQAIVKVNVKYSERSRPPHIVLITGRGRTDLDENTVSLLDWAQIENVDLIFRAYDTEIQGRRTVTAYLKTMYVTIREDELDLKYMDVPDAPESAASAMLAEAASEDAPPF